MDERIYEIFNLCLGPAGGRMKIYPNAKHLFPCNDGILKQKSLTILDADDPSRADAFVLTRKDLRMLNGTRTDLQQAVVLLLQSGHDGYPTGNLELTSLASVFSRVKRYAIMPGINNPRWIIPLGRGKVSAASLDIYQPSLLISRLAKKCAQFFLRIDSRFMPMDRLSIFSNDEFAGIYDLIRNGLSIPSLEIALFTGTPGYSRKITVQIMDKSGGIFGYCRLAETGQGTKLIKNEARTLINLSHMNIRTAQIPEVLFYQEKDKYTVLIQSSCPKPFWLNNFSFKNIHQAFLEELFSKTSSINSLPLSHLLCFNPVKEMVSSSGSILQGGLRESLSRGAEAAGAYVPGALCLSHGDYTPWNTSVKDGKLFVFDWEYANIEPPLMDVIHFVMQYMILVKNKKFGQLQDALYGAMSLLARRLKWNLEAKEMKLLLMYYLLKMISLKCEAGRYGEWTEEEKKAVAAWGGMLDTILREAAVA